MLERAIEGTEESAQEGGALREPEAAYMVEMVRDGLEAGGMLREVEVTAAMPKVRPWS